jgi:hypothetical protein
MPEGKFKLKMPRVYSYGNNGVSAKATLVKMSADDTHTVGVWPGMWTLASTNGQISTATGSDTVDYVVEAIYDAAGKLLDKQYLTAAQLNASDYYISAVPIGGIIFEITEDGVTAPISAAESGATTAMYADIIVAEPDAASISSTDDPYGAPCGSLMISSNTSDGTAGTLTLQLLGPSPRLHQEYSATAGSKRTFLAKVRSAGFSQ